jgi:hypothetical protein
MKNTGDKEHCDDNIGVGVGGRPSFCSVLFYLGCVKTTLYFVFFFRRIYEFSNYFLWRSSRRVQPLNFDGPAENSGQNGLNMCEVQREPHGENMQVVTAEDIYSIEYADPPQVYMVVKKFSKLNLKTV